MTTTNGKSTYNAKKVFIEWATDCMGWSKNEIKEAIYTNGFQIKDHIPDDEYILSELKEYLKNN